MVNYACAFSQSESGKYFEWIIIILNASVNSSWAQPPPPGYCGAFARLVSPRGWGICKFCAARGPSICQTPGQARAFDMHAVSYQNITQRILLEKQADWLIFWGREKSEEVCKGMFSILCMHFFIAYQARITQRKLGSYRHESTLFGYCIKFLLVLFEEHPFIFIKLFIAVNFTARY